MDDLSAALSGLHLSEGRIALVLVICRGLGEGFSTLKDGGGLVGLGRSLLYGQNIPKPISSDYHEELKSGGDAA